MKNTRRAWIHAWWICGWFTIALVAGQSGGCDSETPCGPDLPILRLTGEISLWRGHQVIRDNGTPEGCLGWSHGDELEDFLYLRQWGVPRSNQPKE